MEKPAEIMSLSDTALSVADLSEATAIENLQLARQLVASLEQGNVEQADVAINQLCQSRENVMFQDLGKLTRELHDAMNEVGSGARLNDIMHNEMPDVRHNLDHVIELTEDAANKTLTAAEQCSTVITNLNKRVADLQGLLQGDINSQSINNPRDNKSSLLNNELDEFLAALSVDMKAIHKEVNSIMLAQGFQDLSGQIIQRVSKMVHDVETSLVGILKINSQFNNPAVKKCNAGYGPAVPGVSTGEVMQNQDDVDDLLSTLGF